MLLTALVLAAATLAAQPTPTDTRKSKAEPGMVPADYLISNVTIVDPASGTAREGMYVKVRGDRIATIFQGESADIEPNHHIDGTGKFLIPGLIDSHVHYIDEETFGPMFIANGVTLVRDMGGSTDQILALRDHLNKGETLGPRMLATGAIVDGKPAIWPFSEECDTPDEARAAVQKLKAAGVDFIKVYSMLKPEVYRAAVEEAKKAGLMPVGHIPKDVSVAEAVEAGQVTSEHMLALQPLIIAACPENPAAPQPRKGIPSYADMTGWLRLKEADRAKLGAELSRLRAMVQVPTVVVMEGISRAADADVLKDPLMEYVGTGMRSFWSGEQYGAMAIGIKPALPGMKEFLGDLHKAGVPMLIGTDLANPYVFAGFSVHREMEIFQQAGIPAADVLKMATSEPARVFKIDADYGSISEGKVASMVLLNANPLTDIKNASTIEGVFLAGRYHDRAALDAMLKDAKAAAASTVSAPTASKLELPGEVVKRGRYTMTFGRGKQVYPAGSEEFLITKADDGWRVMVQTAPEGGWSKPSLSMVHLNPDWTLKSATYKELSPKPVEAVYAVEGDRYTAKATREGKELPVSTLAIPKWPVFGGPTTAGSITMIEQADLKPGESKVLDSVGFGMPDWKLATLEMTLKREDDRTVKLGKEGSQRELPARYYVANLVTPMGKIEQRLWVDEHNVVLRCEVVIPFGTSIAELEAP